MIKLLVYVRSRTNIFFFFLKKCIQVNFHFSLCYLMRFVDNILSVAFSADGTIIATAGQDNAIKLVSVAEKRIIFSFQNSHPSIDMNYGSYGVN